MLPYFTRIKRYVIKPTCENFSSFNYFFYEKTVKMHSAIFVFILMAGVTHYSKTVTLQQEIFQGKLSAIVTFIPCKFMCKSVNFLYFFCLTDVVQGL